MTGSDANGDVRRQPGKVLVVDADVQNVQQLGEALRKRGCEPLEATSYEAAKLLWTSERPPMLIADVRLGQFNGLQLLLRALIDRPDVNAVITCPLPDKVLENETRRFGATFLIKPVRPGEVVDALLGSVPQPEQKASSLLVERRNAEQRQLPVAPFSPDQRRADPAPHGAALRVKPLPESFD